MPRKKPAPTTPNKNIKAPKLERTATVEGIQNKDPEDAVTRLGRKPAPINWDKVETAMALGADLKTCAAFGGVHHNTLEIRILERYGERFTEVRHYFLADRKAMALKALWNLVAKGNTRATLFVNRALNGMDDRVREPIDDDNADDGNTFKLAYDPHEKPPIDADFTTKENQ